MLWSCFCHRCPPVHVDEVIKKYKNAKSNLEELQKLGAYVLHGVDATVMKFHPDLKMQRFDRIIFNFPHAGFHGKEDNLMMIMMHMDLVFGFFKNACQMLRANGEIHVNHKTTPPFNDWNIEKLANQSFLTMIDCIDFNKEDYPGYNNKRGDSYRCDDPFPLGECSTFKFICNPRSMKNHLRGNHIEISRQQTILPFHEEIQSIAQFPAPVDLNYLPRTSLFPKMNQFNCYPQTNHFLKLNEPIRSEFDLRNGYNPISREINNLTEILEILLNLEDKVNFEGEGDVMDHNIEPIELADPSGGEELEEDRIHVTPIRAKRNRTRPKYLRDYVDQ